MIAHCRYYKTLNEDGTECTGKKDKWDRPKNGQPGNWMPKIEVKETKLYVYGYHLFRRESLIDNLGPTIWLAEGKGTMVAWRRLAAVFEQARLVSRLPWDDRVIRRFAADCTDRLVKFHGKECANSELQKTKNNIEHYRDQCSSADTTTKDLLPIPSNVVAGIAFGTVGPSPAGGNLTWERALTKTWIAEQDWQTERLFEYLEGRRK